MSLLLSMINHQSHRSIGKGISNKCRTGQVFELPDCYSTRVVLLYIIDLVRFSHAAHTARSRAKPRSDNVIMDGFTDDDDEGGQDRRGRRRNSMHIISILAVK